MTRFGKTMAVLAVLLCSGCVWTNGNGDNEAWLNMMCPTGEGEQRAEDLLDAIIAWAPPPPAIGAAAKVKAEECKLHTAATEMHCAKLVTAWTAAKQAATTAGLSQATKDALWTLCISELTHGSDGGGAGSLSAWPDVECPDLSGVIARTRLEWIIANAPPNSEIGGDADDKCITCRDTHTGVSALHCTRVYSAHVFAQSAVASPSPTKEVFWTLCVSELTHGSDGGGVGDGS